MIKKLTSRHIGPRSNKWAKTKSAAETYASYRQEKTRASQVIRDPRPSISTGALFLS